MKNLQNLKGAQLLSKQEQQSINGGDLSGCTKNYIVGATNLPDGIYFECYDSEVGGYIIMDAIGNYVSCPEY
jgi:hypothetical protein